MSPPSKVLPPGAVVEAVQQLRAATAARKCWSCGCLHGSLDAIERAIAREGRLPELARALDDARARLLPVRQDCLGCEVCHPPLAMNALDIGAEACPTEPPRIRDGWPPLPGSYTVLRYRAPVAVCTLTDAELAAGLASTVAAGVAMVGHVCTENLGIERVVQNVVANPNIRFLVVCGADSRQAVGHLPGQSLVALARNGLDEHGRILGALGRRPVLSNVGRDAVEHFRSTVEVVDLVGNTDRGAILAAVAACVRRDPGPAAALPSGRSLVPVRGSLPQCAVADPAGYFVVYADPVRRLLSLEHYANDGVLDAVIEGATAAETCFPAIERGLVSRLDHAAYLGRELARAEHSLRTGEPYVQDAAPEAGAGVRCCSPTQDCGCGPATGAGAS